MHPERIEIIRGADGWMARFVGDADTLRLFGTDTIPTPFGLSTPAQAVQERIQSLNPGVPVTVSS